MPGSGDQLSKGTRRLLSVDQRWVVVARSDDELVSRRGLYLLSHWLGRSSDILSECESCR